MLRKIFLVLLFAVLAYGALAFTKESNSEAASGSYLMARFWDNKNFTMLIWEHYHDSICPTVPSIGNVNLAMAGVDNRFESANAYGYDGFCEVALMYSGANHTGASYQCGGMGCGDLVGLNNDVSSYKLYR